MLSIRGGAKVFTLSWKIREKDGKEKQMTPELLLQSLWAPTSKSYLEDPSSGCIRKSVFKSEEKAACWKFVQGEHRTYSQHGANIGGGFAGNPIHPWPASPRGT